MANKFSKGDKVLGPNYNRGLPIYTVIECFHSPNGNSIYKIRVGENEQDASADQMAPEEVLKPYSLQKEGSYVFHGGTLFCIQDGQPKPQAFSDQGELIAELLNKHQA